MGWLVTLQRPPPSPVLAVTVLDSMYLGQRPQPLWAILYGGDSSVRCSMMSGIPASAYPMSVAVPLPPTPSQYTTKNAPRQCPWCPGKQSHCQLRSGRKEPPPSGHVQSLQGQGSSQADRSRRGQWSLNTGKQCTVPFILCETWKMLFVHPGEENKAQKEEATCLVTTRSRV